MPAVDGVASMIRELLEAERSWVEEQAEQVEAAASLLASPSGEPPRGDPLLGRLVQTLNVLAARFRTRAAALDEAVAALAEAEPTTVEPGASLPLLV